MAHGFRNLGVNTTFASRKELAWHKLGKTVEAMTSEEAIKLGGLDFDVELVPIFVGTHQIDLDSTPDYNSVIRHGKGKNVIFFGSKEIKTNFATMRTDTKDVFGIVGSRYEVIQNIEAFDFFDDIIGQGHAQYETVGALGNGERIFITAKLPTTIKVGKDDIDKYLLFTKAHDGSGAIQVMFTPIRVVCNNTLSMAIGASSNKVNIRHTRNARQKLEITANLLGIVEKQSNKFSDIFNTFANERLSDVKIKEVIKQSFGFTEDEDGLFSTKAANIMNNVLEYHEIGVGQENIKGTKWGVLNAVTGYQQNGQVFKNEEVRFDSIYNKQSASIRQKAFNTLLTTI